MTYSVVLFPDPLAEEKQSGEPSRISWVSTHFATMSPSNFQNSLRQTCSKRYGYSSRSWLLEGKYYVTISNLAISLVPAQKAQEIEQTGWGVHVGMHNVLLPRARLTVIQHPPVQGWQYSALFIQLSLVPWHNPLWKRIMQLDVLGSSWACEQPTNEIVVWPGSVYQVQ